MHSGASAVPQSCFCCFMPWVSDETRFVFTVQAEFMIGLQPPQPHQDSLSAELVQLHRQCQDLSGILSMTQAQLQSRCITLEQTEAALATVKAEQVT